MHSNVCEYLEESSKKFPKKVAFSDGNESITFGFLQLSAKKIASKLSFLACRNLPIIIIGARTVKTVELIWGVVYSGNTYCIIDEDNPIERVLRFIQKVKPCCILYQKTNKNIAEQLNVYHEILFSYDEVINSKQDDCLIEKNLQSINLLDPCYIVFTSGSTGEPKAILKNHLSLISFVETYLDTFSLDSTDVFISQASFEFDVSAKSIYIPVSIGANVFIMPKQFFLSPAKIANYLIETHASVLIWSASAVKYLQTMRVFSKQIPKNLKYIMFSGECLPMQTAEYICKKIQLCTLVNLYAPSEVTGNCMYCIVKKDILNLDSIPLGKCFRGMRVRILDENLNDSDYGEIFINGPFLSSGYLNDEKNTKQSFINLNSEDKAIYYRTGDIAKIENGHVFFVSRKDFQIKISGHRVELGEIENIINNMQDIDSSCCIYDKNKQIIVAFYVSSKVEHSMIAKILKEKMPLFAIPKQYYRLKEMPINTHGKIDRQKILMLYKCNTSIS